MTNECFSRSVRIPDEVEIFGGRAISADCAVPSAHPQRHRRLGRACCPADRLCQWTDADSGERFIGRHHRATKRDGRLQHRKPVLDGVQVTRRNRRLQSRGRRQLERLPPPSADAESRCLSTLHPMPNRPAIADQGCQRSRSYNAVGACRGWYRQKQPRSSNVRMILRTLTFSKSSSLDTQYPTSNAWPSLNPRPDALGYRTRCT